MSLDNGPKPRTSPWERASASPPKWWDNWHAWGVEGHDGHTLVCRAAARCGSKTRRLAFET